MSAENLIKRVATGDKNAFEKLYNNYFKLVFATAWSVTQNRCDAEDVAAECFTIVWKKADTFNGSGGKSWLCRIAKNLALTLIAKRNRETILEDNERGGYSDTEKDTENKMMLESALNLLTEKERETVLLFNSGLKHREIAEVFDEKLGTITWRYSVALKKMRDFLESDYE